MNTAFLPRCGEGTTSTTREAQSLSTAKAVPSRRDGVASSSSLDHPETTGLGPHTRNYAAWRSRKIPQEEIAATRDVLKELFAPEEDGSPDVSARNFPLQWNRYHRFIHCRRNARFAVHRASHEVKVIATTCKDRWCPTCAATKAARIASATRSWVGTLDTPKLLTLTIRSTNLPLSQQLDIIIAGFNRLRRDKELRRVWRGGIWFLQITFNKQLKQWHPHIHAVVDGDFIAQKTIATKWAAVTSGSPVVDIRAIKDPKAASAYVARYVSRPCELAPLDHDHRLELVEALKGRRLCNTFGTAHKAALLAKPPAADMTDYAPIASWETLIEWTKYSHAARIVWNCWRTKTPLREVVDFNDIDNFLAGIPPSIEKKISARQLELQGAK